METSGKSKKEVALRLRKAAEEAVQCIGLGFDLTLDLRLKYSKKQITGLGSRLIGIDEDQVRDIAIPGGILVQNVPKSINCDKGERVRFSSDILSFQQMSEQFNQELSLSGKIPTGHFNAAFEFTGSWQKDAAFTKSLAFDGVFISLYSIALEKTQVALRDHVKQEVPSSWDPLALSRFIEKYGTHIIVGVKMGGKDVVYVKQHYASPLKPGDVLKKLKVVADKRFGEASGQSGMYPYAGEMHDSDERESNFLDLTPSFHSNLEDITYFWRRRGGSNSRNMAHNKWCQTVQMEPEVMSMSFVPISSLLSGIDGSGFLGHAINLYLRYKPPIEELQQFLEFQLPRQWAPVFGDLPLGPDGKQQGGASLQFSFMGPKLYVNTNEVDVANRPVTGLRLYLEGKKSNCLAIHLQHLSSLPNTFQLSAQSTRPHTHDRRYYEKVQSQSFSHVCTSPIQSDDDLSIVTGAQFDVREINRKNILFLHLHFSKVANAVAVKTPEWDGPAALVQKSGLLSTISTRFSTGQKAPPKPSDINVNSALYPDGPPMAAPTRKMLKYVDTTEMMRGPQDPPGYWVVSGARLMVDRGKISLRVKYSLLTVVLPDEEVLVLG